jgi:hypothetical protein
MDGRPAADIRGRLVSHCLLVESKGSASYWSILATVYATFAIPKAGSAAFSLPHNDAPRAPIRGAESVQKN